MFTIEYEAIANKSNRESGSRRPAFLTKEFVLLFAAHLIVVSVYFLFMTTMARHAIETFACSDSTAGFVASIFLVGGVCARVVAGRYSDAIGLKRCSLAALVLMLASCLAYPVADMNLPLMFVVRFLHGVSFGIANTTIPAIATEIIPLEVMGEGTGWFMLSNSLGVGMGPLFGLLVTSGFEYSVLYWGCAALAAVALAATVPIAAGRVPADGARKAIGALPKFKASDILDPATRRFSFYMFIVAFAYSSISAFVDSYSASIGLTGWAAAVFAMYSIVLVLIRPSVGRLQDRRGENIVLYPSIASLAVGLLICASCTLAPNGLLLASVGIFAATGMGTCLSTGLAVIGCATHGDKAAPGIATFYLLSDLGCGVGPVLLGLIVSAFGYAAMYVVCAGIALLGVVYYHFSHGKDKCGAAGHVKSVTVSDTAEIELRPVVGGTIGRKLDPETGTGFWSFPA